MNRAETIGAESSRIHHLDLVRGWAIFLMIVIHTVRGFLHWDYKHAEKVDMGDWVDQVTVAVRAFLYTTEPYISALFLTVAGFALVVAYRPGRGWYRRRLRRCTQLIVLSWTIHWIHVGVNPPYPFLSAEILYTIGLGIILTAGLAPPSRYRWPGVVALSLLCVAITWFAQGSPDHWVARLAQGPGAHLPNLLFFPTGIALAVIWQSSSRTLWLATLGAGMAVLLSYHLVIAPPVQTELARKGDAVSTTEAIFNQPFGRIVTDRMFVVDARFGSTYDLKWLAHQAGFMDEAPRRYVKRRSYWNKKLELVPYLVAWMCVTFGLAWFFWGGDLGTRPGSSPRLYVLFRPLALMGRYPLTLYLLHLGVIAALVAALGGNRSGPGLTLGAVLVMLLLCGGVAWLKIWVDTRCGGRD
jgi:uncharacterized membrane protein